MVSDNALIVTGKRKSAVAKAKIVSGKGIVLLNKKPISILPYLQQLEISEPIMITKDTLGRFDFDIFVNVKGGGNNCQVEAARLAIARALVRFTRDDELKKAFLNYDRNLLVADTRRKEVCKPGDSKARAMRQTSFR